jgi:chromosome partitioning protein
MNQEIIAVANQKGGVGKTATVLALAGALGVLDLKVLIVDLDPQATATGAYIDNPAELDETMYEALMNKKVIEPKYINRNLYLLPSNITLAKAEKDMPGIPNSVNRLRLLLRNYKEFQVILIDCPPTLSFLTYNGLIACQSVLIPCSTDPSSIQAIPNILETIQAVVDEEMNREISKITILPTRHNPQTVTNRTMLDFLNDQYSELVSQEVVRSTVKYQTAYASRRWVGELDNDLTKFWLNLARSLVILESGEVYAAR